jgi:hypothetical protein
MIKLLSEEHILYDIIEPSVLRTNRMPRKLEDYDALIFADVTNMDDRLVSVIDNYVKNGGKVLVTGFTSTKDISGKPLNQIRLQSLGVDPSFEMFEKARSTYLKISAADKAIMGEKEFRDFNIMMLYSDFMKCRPVENAKGYMRFLPSTRFGPPEKAYYTKTEITDYPGLIANSYGKGKSVFIPWELGAQYRFKGHYMHRELFVAALDHLLNVDRTIITNASPLIEISHLANRNGAFEWLGMINHSGQIGASLREPVIIHNTTIRFKPVKPIREIRLLRAGSSLDFKQADGWVECTISQISDFEMVLCLYK